MKCALCKKEEATKKNTHFLTDGIIRSCLNLDGSNKREQGFYFDLSNNTPFIEYNFQRSTPIEKLEEGLNRPPSDEEIERAKEVPFSVDFVFCETCEGQFSQIETAFINNILPKFRDHSLKGIKEINLENADIIRMFFYIQIWRTSVCDDVYKVSDNSKEKLRKTILGINETEEKFPLIISYLETLGGSLEYTTNIVGYTSDIDPSVIFMNDFHIQFFESKESIRILDLHGINNLDTFNSNINLDETFFKIVIIENSKRKQIFETLQIDETVKDKISSYQNRFVDQWIKTLGYFPNSQIIHDYLDGLINNDTSVFLKYSKSFVDGYTNDFISKRRSKRKY